MPARLADEVAQPGQGVPLAKVNPSSNPSRVENGGMDGGRAFMRGFNLFRSLAPNAIAQFETCRHGKEQSNRNHHHELRPIHPLASS